VVLFEGRAGSSWIVEALDSHPAVLAAPERFVSLRRAGPVAQLTWARALFDEAPTGLAAVGFKTKLRDVLDPIGFSELLISKDVSIIHLVRRDRVKAVVSEINAARLAATTGEYNLYRETDRLPPVKIDPEQFIARLKLRATRDATLAKFVAGLSLPVLRMSYEDLLVDKQAFVRNLLEFLGAPRLPLTGRALKGTADDLSLAVSNWEEIADRAAEIGLMVGAA
jgi:LPS sulfotransferase NodH